MPTHSTPSHRLLMIGAGYPPHGPRGGYELSWASFTRHANRSGVETAVLTTEPVGTIPGTDEGVVLRTLRTYRVSDGTFRSLSLRQRMHLEIHDHAALRRAIHDFAPDTIMFWVMGGLPVSLVDAAARSGIRTALWVCDLWTEYGLAVDAWQRLGRRAGRLGAALDVLPGLPSARVHLGKLDAFWLFPSTYLRDRVASRSRLDPSRTHVVPSPVAPEFFGATGGRRTGWSGRLAFCGRSTRAKGADVAVRALALGPPTWTLTLAGEPGDARTLELGEEVGVAERVVTLPSLTRPDVARLMSESDVVLFPARSPEALGLVPLEAMAVGTPVVMTVTGGPADYARDGDNCLVVPSHDPAATAAAVRRLEHDVRLRARLIERGRATAEAYREVSCNGRALAVATGAAA